VQTADRNYWLTWSASLLFFVAFYTLLIPLPLYLAAIPLPDWQIGVILGAFGVASLIGRPLAGLGADRLGYRQIMLGGTVTLLLGVLGMMATRNPVALFGLRLLQAAGYVAFTTASNALVVALTAPAARKSMLTRFGAAANVAMTLTPATINALLGWLTIHGALWVAGVFALISGGLAWGVKPVALPEQATSAPPAAEPQSGWRIPRDLVLPLILAVIGGCAFGAFLQFLPLLTERRGNLINSGWVFATYGASIALTRFLIAGWIDRGDQRLILRMGYLLLATGLFLLASAQVWYLFVLGALVIAAGSGLQTGVLMTLHVEALPTTARARGIAFYYLGFDLGIGGGAWLLAPVLQQWGIGRLYTAAALLALVGAGLVQGIKRSGS
jgi:MFS family permease